MAATAPLTYTLTPAVPGLGFDAATRRLSGTPTRAGTYRMTYRADDDDDNTGDSDAAIRTFTITVQAADDFAPRMYGTVAAQTYSAGTAIFALRLPTAYGGDGALTYTLTPAVPGLGFDAATRRLSGTPTRAGTYRMTYRADDDDDNTGDSDAAVRTFTITVQAADDFALAHVRNRRCADLLGGDGDIFALRLPTAYGGDGAQTYTLTPAVPGLGFDAATRRSAAPRHGRAPTDDLRADDDDDNTGDSDAAVRTFTITVQAADDFAPRMFEAVAAQTYTEGTANLRPEAAHRLWRRRRTDLHPHTGSARPRLDAATRRLSGTPTRAGTYRMTYRADDDDDNTGDNDAAVRTFTVTVQAADDFAPRMYGTVAAQTYTEGTAIFALRLPTAYGGDGALTYTLTPAVPGLGLRRRHPPAQRHPDAGGHLPDDLPGRRRRRQHRGQRCGHPHLHHHVPGGARRRSGSCARVRLRDSVRQTGRRAALHLRRDGPQPGQRGISDIPDAALLLLPGRHHLRRRQGGGHGPGGSLSRLRQD